MRRLDDAVTAFRSGRRPGVPVSQAEATALREVVHRANEVLRSFGRRFEVLHGGSERIPPTRPVPPAAEAALAPGSPGALAVAARRRVAALTATASPSHLFDALEFAPLDVTASGGLGAPLARDLPGIGLEALALTPEQIRALPTNPPWLASRLAAAVEGWERAHLVGPGFGGELFAGLMLAPEGVNQTAQNRIIEEALRVAATVVADPEVTVRAEGRRLAVPLRDGSFEFVDVLHRVTYDLDQPSGVPLLFVIEVQPDGHWRVTQNDLPPGSFRGDAPTSGTR
ncbi:polymorphic toxin type 4 domain-containing protein [Frankia sp. CcWB3]